MKIRTSLLGVFLCLVSVPAIAEYPVFPGAKKLEGPGAPADVVVNIGEIAGKRVPQVRANSSTTRYAVPTATSFADVKRFYAKELAAKGLTEKATVAVKPTGMVIDSVSFGSADGVKSVTITLMNNPVDPAEKWLLLSEVHSTVK